MKCTGIFFVEFQRRFHATASVTSLIDMFHNLAYSISGEYNFFLSFFWRGVGGGGALTTKCNGNAEDKEISGSFFLDYLSLTLGKSHVRLNNLKMA